MSGRNSQELAMPRPVSAPAETPSTILRGELALAKREISALRKIVVAPQSQLDNAVAQIAASAARETARSIVAEFESRMLAAAANTAAKQQRTELTTHEVAAELGLQVTTVRTMLKDGRLKGSVLPGTRQYRVRRSDLDAYRRQLQQGSAVDENAKVIELTRKLRLRDGEDS
jgi:excisionase family DNA binding protein